jgi:uncharacterized protein YciI
MLFLIYAEDVADSEEIRGPLRDEHIARRERLHGAGRILASGPLSEQQPGKPYCGSLMIGEFGSMEEAQRWAQDDPYARAGVYRRLVVRHFNQHFRHEP